jgi:hypothetical protein
MSGRALGLVVVAITLCAPPVGAQRLGMSGLVLGSRMEHRVNAGLGVEQASGFVFGGQGRVRFGSWFELGGHGFVGTLTPDSTFATERRVTEADVVGSLTAIPWLALQVGGSIRSYEGTLARQRWASVRVGGEGRLDLARGRMRGIVRAGLMPYVEVSGLTNPTTALYAGAGLEIELRPFVACIIYQLERYDFPAQAGLERSEQLASLTAGLGIALGR